MSATRTLNTMKPTQDDTMKVTMDTTMKATMDATMKAALKATRDTTYYEGYINIILTQ